MKTITVRLFAGRGYFVKVNSLLVDLGRALKPLGFGPKVLIVSTPPVARHYAARLAYGLKKSGFTPSVVLIPDGEDRKDLKSVQRIYSACLRARLDRHSLIVALGGGVVGDVAGFAAATYMRGISCVQCPTSLLAMVDASIGGKTAVDLPQGKNLIGAFWQPRLVWMDLSVLKTLPEKQWHVGMAEIIKYGVIADPGILSDLESLTPQELRTSRFCLERLVARSAEIKARVVSRDETETRGIREMLNFGHTLGHALETVVGYRKISHGEAISVGMVFASRLANRLRYLSSSDADRLEKLIRRWGLPVRAPGRVSRAAILKAMSRDKKVMAGRWRFVLPFGWGQVKVVDNIPRSQILSALQSVGI
ncbi:MAG TPA: 3-dehydroquinate synthase [Elusimicrobiota bacterium]|nr:3-dehydroquinate synthase [Elusimicrobiota bacterium]